MEVIPTDRTSYTAYLQGASWRITRNRALKRASFRCERCGSKHQIEVHHRTYERLGHEWDADLEAVCSECHRAHHVKEKLEGPERVAVYMKLAMAVWREEPYDSMASLSGAVKDACLRSKIPYDAHQVDRALALLGKEITFRRPKSPAPEPDRSQMLADLGCSAPPCMCAECLAAGVSDRRQHRDPGTLDWLHGEPLRRWHEARDRFHALAQTVTFPSMPEVPALECNEMADMERANQMRRALAANLAAEAQAGEL